MNWFNFLAVEGPIGAGKTSLAKMISERFDGKLICEHSIENPFLKDFYQNPERFAFQAQIYFLLIRYKSQLEFRQRDLFHKLIVSDFIYQKDRIFASVTLNEKEFDLYNKIASFFEKEVVFPDLIIYLQSNVKRLMNNIKKRHVPYEMDITDEYLKLLVEAYNQYFFQYNASPVLIVNTSQIDFISNEKDFENILDEIENPFKGIRYFNPI